ncbi:hypothetical protein LAJ19_20080 (plasmid) [Deinococcus taeanensis]|uniref:FtsX-like permease family protein n=1 Tax=Deinococcus taeanensis TaxID=2737050 RepID=UPI001CDBA696|nr:FtsX-like permease family protein [Deinococcus taeanensis]UBV45430.1 hypothetical protein LAJ19_20080 [Deinococcus taeanensis]
MLKLFAQDFKQHALQWLWTLVVATVGGACLGALLTTASSLMSWAATQPKPSELMELAALVRGQVASYVSIAAAVVVASTANLTITAQSREYALWKILGVPAQHITRVILLQLMAVGVMGGILGAVLSPLGTRLYLHTWGSLGDFTTEFPITFERVTLPVVAALTAAFTVIGGFGAARRGGRLPEMQALRESEAPQVRVGLISKCFAGLLIWSGGVIWFLPLLDPNLPAADRIPPELLGGTFSLLLVTAALLLGPWTVRPLLFAWTALIPSRNLAWFAAREACRYRSGQSMATILPFAVAIALTGTIYGMSAAGPEVAVSGFQVIFAPIFVICAVGGVANIVLVGGQRLRDLALLRVLGGDDRTLAAVPVWEGAIYAATGILFGLVATGFTVGLTAVTAQQPIWKGFADLPWIELVGLSLGSLTLAIGAVAASVIPANRESAMDMLRQPT